MCNQHSTCWRAGDHPGVRHRFVATVAERKAHIAAQNAERMSHISRADQTKIGRFNLRKGDAVRLRQAPGKKKWLGVFQCLETNAKSGSVSAVVVGGKVGGICFTRNLNPDDLIYLRPDSADAKQARILVEMAKVA